MKKRRLEIFQTNDNEAIEKHLAKMAKKGWFLENIGIILWTYRKGEPQDLTYEVTYFSEASDFNPYPTDNQEAYYEYCKAAGWTLAAAKDKLQVFNTTMENPTPIESDEGLKFQSIHRSMKKSMLPAYGILLISAIFQVIASFINKNINPLLFYKDNIGIYNLIIWIIFALGLIYYFIDYGVWYYGTKKAIASGIKYQRNHYKGRRVVNIAVLFLSFILVMTIVGKILLSDYWWIGLMVVIIFTFIAIVFFIIKNTMKRAGVSGKINIAVTLIALTIAVVISINLIIRGMVYEVNNGVFDRKAYSSYSFTDNYGNMRSHDIYKDSLPLTLENMYVDIDNRDYSYELQQDESFAINYIKGSQKPPFYLENDPHLFYELVEVKASMLYDTFKDYFITTYGGYDKGKFLLAPDSTWGAEEVYQLENDGEFNDIYLLCYEDKIIFLVLGFPPLKEQIEVIREKLIGDKLELKYTLKDRVSEDNILFGEVRE